MLAPQGHDILRQPAERRAVWGLYNSFVRKVAKGYISITAFYAMAYRLMRSYGVSLEDVVDAVPSHNPQAQALRAYIQARWTADMERGEVANRPQIFPVPGSYCIHYGHWNLTLYQWAEQPFDELIQIITATAPAALGFDTEFCAYSNHRIRGNARHDWLAISIPGRTFLYYRPLNADVAAFFSYIFTQTQTMVCVFDGRGDLEGITAPPDQVFDAAVGHGQGYTLHVCARQELNIFLDKSYTHFDWSSPVLTYYEGNYLAMDSMVPLFVWHHNNTDLRITDFHPPGHAYPHY